MSMVRHREAARNIVIVGGGASSVILAAQLRRHRSDAHIRVVDPSPALGKGIAYSTQLPCHLLNVRAGGLSPFPQEPAHFLSWVQENSDSAATAGSFMPRMEFGRYLTSLVEQSGVEHVRALATRYDADDHSACVMLDDGRVLPADVVVIATGHCAPVSIPTVSADAVADGIYQQDAWNIPNSLSLSAELPVLLVGTGLTSIDVVLQLRRNGYTGQIIAISRHGLLPHGHAAAPPCPAPALCGEEPASALAYYRGVRRAVDSGVPWRAAIDSLRGDSNSLWERLPIAQKRQFRRHLLHRWSVLRHRMAPAISEAIHEELRAGSLSIRKGQVSIVDSVAKAGVATTVSSTGVESIRVNCVVNCTGPDTDYRRSNSDFVQGIFKQGFAVPGALGVTLVTDRNGAVVDSDAKASDRLFALGPVRAGTLFETTAIPEISKQAMDLAALIT